MSRKLFLRISSTILAFICSFGCIGCINTFASEKEKYSQKIDQELIVKMETVQNDEKIPVSIWFKEDENSVENYVKQQVIDKIGEDKSDLINIAFKGKDAVDSFAKLSESTKSLEKSMQESGVMQRIIEIKRTLSAKSVHTNNAKMITKVIKDIKFMNFDINEDIIYQSKYLPNIELNLTKDSIKRIALSANVDSIYCRPDIRVSNDTNMDSVVESSIDDDYENADFGNFYQYTKLDTNREAFGLNGFGVKIGICDQEYAMKNSINMYFTNSPFAGYESNDIFSDIAAPRHGDMVADIIAGQYKNSNGEIEYKGIVPSAKLYLANAGENQQIFKYKTSFEYLASQGCSVINMSRYVGEDPESTYGDTAKWIDSFIQRYNINVIMSAGNITTGGTGVTSGKMSYNSIVVGSCDKDGVIASDSCYSSSNAKAYKPDLTAYGVNVNIPTRPFGVSGTSCAAPMVTGLVAQMCQLSATLRANPTLMKAVIVNSTKRSASMQSNNCMSLPNTVSYPLEHKYGVGIMYAPYAYIMVHDNSYFGYGTLSSTETSTTFSKQITKATNKLIRIVATVKNDYPELPLETIKLQVTDPNGNTYTSQYQYDNKQVVVIKPGISGVYHINLERLNNTNYNLSYAISYNVIAE